MLKDIFIASTMREAAFNKVFEEWPVAFRHRSVGCGVEANCTWVTAVARKLVTIANALCKNRQKWAEHPA